jgi:hypothetical protein
MSGSWREVEILVLAALALFEGEQQVEQAIHYIRRWRSYFYIVHAALS